MASVMRGSSLLTNSFRQSVIQIHTEEKKVAGEGATEGQAEVLYTLHDNRPKKSSLGEPNSVLTRSSDAPACMST